MNESNRDGLVGTFTYDAHLGSEVKSAYPAGWPGSCGPDGTPLPVWTTVIYLAYRRKHKRTRMRKKKP